jgi:O-acetylserine/cysteine efflux transporter
LARSGKRICRLRLGLGLVVLAVACWAMGNIVAREGGARNFLACGVWASLFFAPPLLVLSFMLEGPGWSIVHALRHATPWGWAAVVWLGEDMPARKLGAAALVVIGLAISVFYPRLRSLRLG